MALELRPPDGADDVAMFEAQGTPVALALAILPRLARPALAVEAPPAWDDLTVTDFEVALLELRRRLFGDRIACVFDCSHPRCGEPVELEFRISDLLEDVQPRQPRGITSDDARPGWFRLAAGVAAFRLPTIGDQVAVVGQPEAERRLQERCIDPVPRAARTVGRVERAMEQLAPDVSRSIDVRCPVCANALSVHLSIANLVVTELRRGAQSVFDEIHAIAKTYHWSEAMILALPRTRRRAYAERIRRDERGRG